MERRKPIFNKHQTPEPLEDRGWPLCQCGSLGALGMEPAAWLYLGRLGTTFASATDLLCYLGKVTPSLTGRLCHYLCDDVIISIMMGLNLVVSKAFQAPRSEGQSLKCSRRRYVWDAEQSVLVTLKTDKKGWTEVIHMFKGVIVEGP